MEKRFNLILGKITLGSNEQQKFERLYQQEEEIWNWTKTSNPFAVFRLRIWLPWQARQQHSRDIAASFHSVAKVSMIKVLCINVVWFVFCAFSMETDTDQFRFND